jgi:hypothetical protein
VIAMRFDCNTASDDMPEIAAYGTTVTIVAADAPTADAVSANSV